MINGKIPPQAVKAEMAVLGAILLERSAYDRVSNRLVAEDFYKHGHQLIFEAFTSLFSRGGAVDIITTTEELRKKELLEVAGGEYALMQLTTKVASSANIEHHALLVKRASMLRAIIKSCGEALDLAYRENADPFSLLENTSSALFQITTGIREGELSHIGGLGEQALKNLNNKEEGRAEFMFGIPSVDNKVNARPGDVVIIAGRPGMGKTAFALQIARHNSKEWPVPFFSLEMSKLSVAERELGTVSGVGAKRIRTRDLGPDHGAALIMAQKELAGTDLYIDDTPGISVGLLRSKLRKFVSKVGKKVPVVLIDYIQLMTGVTKKGGNREQEIASISRALKEIAKEFDTVVIALAQLSRAVETRGGDKKPMLSDLRESGSIEQDADTVIFMYRPEYYGITTYEDGTPTQGVAEVIVGKQRNGPPGEVKIQWKSTTTSFDELDVNYRYPTIRDPSTTNNYDQTGLL